TVLRRRAPEKAILVAPDAVTTAAAAGAAAALRPAAAALGPRPGLIDGHGTAARLLAVQGSNGCLSFPVSLHLHEAETLGTTAVPIHDDLGRFHRAVRLEDFYEIVVGHSVAQVADVQFPTHFLTPK